MVSDSLVTNLILAYNELVEVRRNAIGYVVENPEESNESVESKHQIKHFDARFMDIKDTRIGRSRIRDSLNRIFKGRRQSSYVRTEQVEEMIQQINVIQEDYYIKTSRRRLYGILSPIAFCAEKELLRYLGGSDSSCNLALTWTVEFEQLTVASTNTGLLEIIEITHKGLENWWTSTSPDLAVKETRVWRNIKNLALKLVYLFDVLDPKYRLFHCLSVNKIDDSKSLERIRSSIDRLKIIGLNLIRFLHIQPDNKGDILPLFGLLVPVIFAFLTILNLTLEDWIAMGSKAVEFLEAYIDELAARRDGVLRNSGFEDRVRAYEALDMEISPSSHQSTRGRTVPSVGVESARRSIEVIEEAVDALKDLNLDEIRMDFSKESYINRGSYGKVYKYTEQSGGKTLAVKFLTVRDSENPIKTKNRLVREARHWKKLQNENIHMLLGFCIHPGFELPGLVSSVCETSLALYLETNRNRIPLKEKLRYLDEIASALTYMHQHEEKLAHGDLRPPNVLLAPGRLGVRYNAVLTDFGVSYAEVKIIGDDMTTLQQTNAPYLAPELFPKRFLPAEKRVTLAGDVYAFGCVFFEVMYEKVPFHFVRDLTELQKEKRKGVFPAQRKEVQFCHWSFLTKIWSLDPANRPLANRLGIDMQRIES